LNFLLAPQAYIHENFGIPPHILLKEDSVQRRQYSNEEVEKMEREFKDLQRRINRVIKAFENNSFY